MQNWSKSKGMHFNWIFKVQIVVLDEIESRPYVDLDLHTSNPLQSWWWNEAVLSTDPIPVLNPACHFLKSKIARVKLEFEQKFENIFEILKV